MAVTLPFADMPKYLDYLVGRPTDGRGRVEMQHIEALTHVAGGPPPVNATGSELTTSAATPH